MTQHDDPATQLAELEAKNARRGVKIRALQGRVQALEEALRPFAEAWTGRAPRHVDDPRAYQKRLARALDGFYSAPIGSNTERKTLTGQHLKDAHDLLATPEETTQ